MVEKVIMPPCNIVDFTRYRQIRNVVGNILVMKARACRHCGAALSEGESEDECSSAGFNAEAPGRRDPARKFYAD